MRKTQKKRSERFRGGGGADYLLGPPEVFSFYAKRNGESVKALEQRSDLFDSLLKRITFC